MREREWERVGEGRERERRERRGEREREERERERERWRERESRAPSVLNRYLHILPDKAASPTTHTGISIKVKSERIQLWVNTYWQGRRNNLKMCCFHRQWGLRDEAWAFEKTNYLPEVCQVETSCHNDTGARCHMCLCMIYCVWFCVHHILLDQMIRKSH